MTVVKIQRPITTSAGVESVWLIYDKFRARMQMLHAKELPASVMAVFNAAPPQTQGYYKQYFDDAEWVPDEERWDLDNVKPVTRRLIW